MGAEVKKAKKGKAKGRGNDVEGGSWTTQKFGIAPCMNVLIMLLLS